MVISAWVGVAIMVMGGQVDIQAAPQAFKTEADCAAFNQTARLEIEAPPVPTAYGLGCVEIKVSDEFKPPEGQKKKLEQSPEKVQLKES